MKEMLFRSMKSNRSRIISKRQPGEVVVGVSADGLDSAGITLLEKKP